MVTTLVGGLGGLAAMAGIGSRDASAEQDQATGSKSHADRAQA
jgi:hypothetical protein